MSKAIKRIVRCVDGHSLLYAWNLLMDAGLPADDEARRKLRSDRKRAQQEYRDHVDSCDGCFTEFEVSDDDQ
jgi:hypothetical protein